MKVPHLLLFTLCAVCFLADAKIPDDNLKINGLATIDTSTTTTAAATISNPEEVVNDEEVLEVTEKTKLDPPLCFHADIDKMCLKKDPPSAAGCECEKHPDYKESVVCCNVTDIDKAISCLGPNTSSWSHIHIINASQNEVSLSKPAWKHLNSLVITNGKIKKLAGDFSKFASIKCLNFSNNNITEIEDGRAFIHLTHLQILDLSFNNLTYIPNIPANAKVDIRRNYKMPCKNLSNAVDLNVNFLYKEQSSCETYQNYSWFNSTASMTIRDLEKMKVLSDACPSLPQGNCTCEPGLAYERISDDYSILKFHADVDCSNMGLTSLPFELPENTVTLNISNNSITSLKPFMENSYYHNIKNLYADHNLITDITDLEGSKFLENFTNLALRTNKIKTIPPYFLSNIMEKSSIHLNSRTLHMNGNYIHCDCTLAKNLKVNHCCFIAYLDSNSLLSFF